jgi:glycerate-2-kinase
MACEAAVLALREQGINVLLLTSKLEGEARDVGTVVGSIAAEMAKNDRPVPKPGAIVLGGETTVRVRGDGKGGRNQELALAASETIAECDGTVVVSVGTDGIDGMTSAAGAIVDGKTSERASDKRLFAHAYLARNDSHTYFSQISDLVLTGPTGTNVGDIVVAVALGTPRVRQN